MTNQLPWDDADGVTTTRTAGGDMHARATSLAHAAMNAVAAAAPANPADTDYGRAQASYQARLVEIRAESAAQHVAANNARAAEAAARKAERQAAHAARLEQSKAEAQQRKLAKAA